MIKRFSAILAALCIMTSMTAYAEETGNTWPNDTLYKDERDIQWNLKQINIPEVWKKGYRGEGTTICVIDSGLNLEHEDLDTSRIVDKYNVFDGSKNVTDSYAKYTISVDGKDETVVVGHGTYVTGVIGAVTNNNKGIAGIADKADIIVVKAFDAEPEHETTTDTLIAALKYVAEQHPEVDVINMSLGTEGNIDNYTREKFQKAIDAVVDKGMIVVAAVGNKGITEVSYPAGLDNVIGVGGTDESNVKCGFSQFNESVFVSAPGDYVGDNFDGTETDSEEDDTKLDKAIPTLDCIENDGYLMVNGTSMSAPHVSGVAAIAKSIYPELTANQFKEILKKTSKDLTAVPTYFPEELAEQFDDLTGYDTLYGYGLIDADKIITEVEKLAKNEYTSDSYRTLEYIKDEEGTSVVVETDDLNASVYIVSYDDNDTLLSARRVDIGDLESEADGNYCRYKIPLPENENEPSKLFLWHGMKGCKTWEPETE